MAQHKKIRWTEEEKNLLQSLYKQKLKYDDILTYFPKRSKAALVLQIKKLQVKRPRHKEINILKRENLIDCWFAGFFLGDGSIEKSNKASLHISKTDIHLLYFLANHFGFSSDRVKQNKKSCRLNFSKGFTLHLQEVFDLRKNKSYGDVVFPSFLTEAQLKCFLLGLFYSDGNAKVVISSSGSCQFAIRFLSSFEFCQKLLKWIQENTKLYAHYNQSSVVQIETKTSHYDLACLEFAGIDAVKLIQWLVEGTESLLPPLNRKLARILEVKTDSVRAIQKVPLHQRFKSQTKRKWTAKETNEFKQYVLENPTLIDEKIGQHFNRSLRAIRHKRKSLGLLKKIEKGSLFQKNSNLKYTPEEILCISGILSCCEIRTEDVLLNLVEELNALPCNQYRPPRAVLGVRIFIKKYIDSFNF
jgi:hypothetical protein